MMMVVYVFKFGIDNVWGERERAFQRDTPENVCSMIILYSILYCFYLLRRILDTHSAINQAETSIKKKRKGLAALEEWTRSPPSLPLSFSLSHVPNPRDWLIGLIVMKFEWAYIKSLFSIIQCLPLLGLGFLHARVETSLSVSLVMCYIYIYIHTSGIV